MPRLVSKLRFGAEAHTEREQTWLTARTPTGSRMRSRRCRSAANSSRLPKAAAPVVGATTTTTDRRPRNVAPTAQPKGRTMSEGERADRKPYVRPTLQKRHHLTEVTGARPRRSAASPPDPRHTDLRRAPSASNSGRFWRAEWGIPPLQAGQGEISISRARAFCYPQRSTSPGCRDLMPLPPTRRR